MFVVEFSVKTKFYDNFQRYNAHQMIIIMPITPTINI